MDKIKDFLKESKEKFLNYIDDVKHHKYKMISPKVQGQVMASAGVIAFIDDLTRKIESGDFN